MPHLHQRARNMLLEATCCAGINAALGTLFGYLARVTLYVVAFTRFAGGGIWLRQESLRHILASPGYASGTIAANVTWIEREFNAGQKHRSIYPSIFNRLRAIAIYRWEIATFLPPCI